MATIMINDGTGNHLAVEASPKIHTDVRYLNHLQYATSQIANHIQDFKAYNPDKHPLTRLGSAQAILFIWMHHTIPLISRQCGRFRTVRKLTILAREAVAHARPDTSTSVDDERMTGAFRVLLAWVNVAHDALVKDKITTDAIDNLRLVIEGAMMIPPLDEQAATVDGSTVPVVPSTHSLH